MVELHYTCMPRSELSTSTMKLSAIQPSHIEDVRLWRNAQMDVLRQGHEISEEQQIEYYNTQVWPTMGQHHPRQILLIYKQDAKPIGYGGLTNIAWEHKRAEVSFLLDPSLSANATTYGNLFLTFLDLLKSLAFQDLSLHRLYTETYSFRHNQIKLLEQAGFVKEGVLKDHIIRDGVYFNSVMQGAISDI